MSDKKLTDKQLLFCEAYLSNGFNGAEASRDAGYSEETAKQIATENLSKPYLRDYIKSRIEVLLDNRTELQKQWIDNVTEMAFYELSGDSETDKYRANDKTKALELLGKYLTLFTEKKEVEHTTLDEDGKKTGINYSKLDTETLEKIIEASKD